MKVENTQSTLGGHLAVFRCSSKQNRVAFHVDTEQTSLNKVLRSLNS